MVEVVRKYGGTAVKVTGAVVSALSGAALAAYTGEPYASSAAGSALGALVDDFGVRRLSRAEEKRVETVVSAAARKIREQYIAGEDYRGDGFFEQDPYDRSTFEEVAEGVMLAAQREHQERKVPYLGNLIANVAFSTNVDRATANRALRTATEISWTQCVLLATVGREDRSLPEGLMGDGAGSWESHTVHQEFIDIAMDGRRLVRVRKPNGPHSYPRFKYRLNEMELDSAGLNLFELMSLAEVPDGDLDELIVRLELPQAQAED